MAYDYHRVLLYAFVVIMATGCVPKEPFPPKQHYPSSSLNVPFIAPRSELCGSTSLEMVALYWHAHTSYVPKLTTQELNDHTLIPAKGGTLQIEMTTTARADGLITYPMEPTFEALFAELQAHHPVIVLVNRSFAWHPLWHYAPVIGYDEKKRSILLHFSDQPNEAISLATFAALWKRSGNWGIIPLPPSELPTSVSSKQFLRAVYEFEKTGDREGAIRAYKKGRTRWSDNTDILFALANAEYSISNFTEAEKNYRTLLVLKPTHPLALNNLAMLLCHSSRSKEALTLLNTTVRDNPKTDALIKASREEIEAGCRSF